LGTIKPRPVVEAAVFWFFCAVRKLTRAAKSRIFWQFLPKLAFILLSSGLIGLVVIFSWYPVVFWGFWGILDDIIDLMVLFMVLENILEPLPSLRSFGGGLFLRGFFKAFSDHLAHYRGCRIIPFFGNFKNLTLHLRGNLRH
jgi:hypothetical protein